MDLVSRSAGGFVLAGALRAELAALPRLARLACRPDVVAAVGAAVAARNDPIGGGGVGRGPGPAPPGGPCGPGGGGGGRSVCLPPPAGVPGPVHAGVASAHGAVVPSPNVSISHRRRRARSWLPPRALPLVQPRLTLTAVGSWRKWAAAWPVPLGLTVCREPTPAVGWCQLW